MDAISNNPQEHLIPDLPVSFVVLCPTSAKLRQAGIDSMSGDTENSQYENEEHIPVHVRRFPFQRVRLDTAYELLELKTFLSTFNRSKHRIAQMEFQHIDFSHTIIPNFKRVAFLKARLRNASKLTLLKGNAGLTLDGSFLGQTTIPHTISGQSFTLFLGVDPSVNISYINKQFNAVSPEFSTRKIVKSLPDVSQSPIQELPPRQGSSFMIRFLYLRMNGFKVVDGDSVVCGLDARSKPGSS